VDPRVLVVAALVVMAGLVVLWEMTFSVDPRIHPHPWVLRHVEPHWENWDQLTWDEKMRIFRRRQVVHWAFVLLVAGLWVFLFVEGFIAGPRP